MPTINTRDLSPEFLSSMDKSAIESIYNGLDAAVTFEVNDALDAQMDDYGRRAYEFNFALNAPVFEMSLRGVLIDVARRQELIPIFESENEKLKTNLARILKEGVGVELNPNSPAQLKSFFYDVMELQPIRKRNAKRQFAPSVGREALERLSGNFFAEPIVNHILAIRDLGKKLGFLRSKLDSDGRLRTAYNVAGTVTSRLNSRENAMETGTNLQNITKKLREIIIADKGMKFANIDLEQADSRNLGGIAWSWFGESPYLDACESGDLHTTVTRMVWPALGWTDDDNKNKFEIAEQKFYRHLSYRDTSKRLGHGTNFLGKPGHMAKQTKIDAGIVEDFQESYFAAFPDIKEWQDETIAQIIRTGYLIEPIYDTRRYFTGRRNDARTHRAAIAHNPQFLTAREINHGIIRIWEENFCFLMLQVHDSILIMYREEEEQEVIQRAQRLIERVHTLKHGKKTRDFFVPTGVEVGWNFGPANEQNPDGLIPWKGEDKRTRQRPANVSLLDVRVGWDAQT